MLALAQVTYNELHMLFYIVYYDFTPHNITTLTLFLKYYKFTLSNFLTQNIRTLFWKYYNFIFKIVKGKPVSVIEPYFLKMWQILYCSENIWTGFTYK